MSELTIPFGSYQKVLGPDHTTGNYKWANKVTVNGSTVWTEDTTPTMLSNLVTYLPFSEVTNNHKKGEQSSYDYQRNVSYTMGDNVGSMASKYIDSTGSPLNNTHIKFDYVPGTNKRSWATDAEGYVSSNYLLASFDAMSKPHGIYKPNNNTGYLGSNYCLSFMLRVNRSDTSLKSQFQYGQAYGGGSFTSPKGGTSTIYPVWYGQATHLHEVVVQSGNAYIFTTAQGSASGSMSNYHYTGLKLGTTDTPNNVWTHVLVNVSGGSVKYTLTPNIENTLVNNGISYGTGWSSISNKIGNGSNNTSNVSGGTHRGAWYSMSGNLIRVCEFRGYNTNITPDSKQHWHILNHRNQKGDLPSTKRYPESLPLNIDSSDDDSLQYFNESELNFQNYVSSLGNDTSSSAANSILEFVKNDEYLSNKYLDFLDNAYNGDYENIQNEMQETVANSNSLEAFSVN